MPHTPMNDEIPGLDMHIAQIREALDSTPRGPWLPSESLLVAMMDEIDRLRAALSHAPKPVEALNIAAPVFIPAVIHYDDGDYSVLLLEDCPTVTGYPPVLVEPLYRMGSKEIVGFQWNGSHPAPVSNELEDGKYYCDSCGAVIAKGACDCTKMQRPVLRSFIKEGGNNG